MSSSEAGRMFQGAVERVAQSQEEKLLAKRRGYNRAYMRRWRANPRHTAREQLIRRRSYHSRKVQKSQTPSRPYRNLYGKLFCAFCRKHPSVTQVTRLKISDADASRYVEIRLPYCGQC